MKIKKIKNMKNNLISGTIYRMISLLFPFIIRMVIINTLSSEYLGLSSLFTSILQALNLMELGLGSTMVFNMYKYVAENDYKKLGEHLNFYKKSYRIIGFLILIIGIILAPFLKVFIRGSYPNDINIYIIYFIYLINTVLSYWLFAYKNAIALAYQRNDIENKVLIITQTLMFLFQIIVLIFLKNYYFYVIFLPLSTIMKNLLVSKRINMEFANIDIDGNITKREKKELINNIKNLFGHQIAFTVINSADNIVLSAVMGLNELAIYNNYYYIFSAIVSLLTIFFNSIQAGIGNDNLTNELESFYLNFKRFRFAVFVIVQICSICLLNMYQPFMEVWMGKSMMLSEYCVVIFSIGFYVTQIRRVITTYKNATGMWKQDWIKPYIVIIVDVILDIILIPQCGVIGAMISTIISMGAIAIPWEIKVVYKYLFKKSSIEYIKFLILNTFLFCINILLTRYICSFIHVNVAVDLLLRLIISVVIPSIVIYISFHKTEYYKWSKERIIKLIKYKE